MLEYKDRLVKAMDAAGCSAQRLANEIGLSYQAVKKVIDGKTNSFSAENNSKAAKYLGVTSDYLALGIQDPRSDCAMTSDLVQTHPVDISNAQIPDPIIADLDALDPEDADVWRAQIRAAARKARKLKDGEKDRDRRTLDPPLEKRRISS